MGPPIGRAWVVMMRTNILAIDWGGGQFQDIASGEYFHASEMEVSHRAGDTDLDWLKRLGFVQDYDDRMVYFTHLPDMPRKG